MSKDSQLKSLSTEMRNSPNLLPRKTKGDEVRMSPELLSFLALDDMAVRQAIATAATVRLMRLEESKIPIGTKPLRRTVTDSIMEIRLSPPWISFSLINDGAGGITVWINDRADPFAEGMVTSGETYSLDTGFPVIHTLYLKAVSGTTAAIRIIGKEGKLIR